MRLSVAFVDGLEKESGNFRILQFKTADAFEGRLQFVAHALDVGFLGVVETVAVESQDLLVTGISFGLAGGVQF